MKKYKRKIYSRPLIKEYYGICQICNRDLYELTKTIVHGSKNHKKGDVIIFITHENERDNRHCALIKRWNAMSESDRINFAFKIQNTINYKKDNIPGYKKLVHDNKSIGAKTGNLKLTKEQKSLAGKKSHITVNNKMKSDPEYKDKITNNRKLGNIKGTKTKIINGTTNTSKSEDKLYKYLVEIYGENNIIRQYNTDDYPFNCDFYIISMDLRIEFNGSWVHMNHAYDKNNKNDIEFSKFLLDKSKYSRYYKRAFEIWTKEDVTKRNLAKNKKLKFIELFHLPNKDELIDTIKQYLEEYNKNAK